MRCLIVDDHPVTLLGFRLLIENYFPAWTVSAVSTSIEAIKHLDPSQPKLDILLVDLMLGDQCGTTVLAHAVRLSAEIRPISAVISSTADREAIALCKAHGARGLVPKTANPASMMQAISVLVSGGEYFPTFEPDDGEVRLGDSNQCIKLTERQRDIVDLVLAGYSNKRIADTLNIACGTVKNYMFDLMRLFSARSRLELALKIQSSNYRSRALSPLRNTQ